MFSGNTTCFLCKLSFYKNFVCHNCERNYCKRCLDKKKISDNIIGGLLQDCILCRGDLPDDFKVEDIITPLSTGFLKFMEGLGIGMKDKKMNELFSSSEFKIDKIIKDDVEEDQVSIDSEDIRDLIEEKESEKESSETSSIDVEPFSEYEWESDDEWDNTSDHSWDFED